MTNLLAAEPGAVCGPLSLRTSSGGRPQLLLAEDSDPVRVVTAAMLKGMGCDVEAVIHGEEAVQQAGEHRFDVIVLDIEMPVMDGITAAKSIRRMGGFATGTPIMALSAFLADSMRAGNWHDAFDIALPKPANRNELHTAVRTALTWHRIDAGQDVADVLPPVISQAELDAIRSGIAASIWQELTELACRDIDICMRQIEQTPDGVQNADVMTYAGKLHALGRTFAAPRLAQAAQAALSAASGKERHRAVALLSAAVRETVKSLRS